MLSERGLGDGPIIRQEGSYLVCMYVCVRVRAFPSEIRCNGFSL